MMSSLNSEADLPVLSAGEIKLVNGRVSGMWKVSRGWIWGILQKFGCTALTFVVLIAPLKKMELPPDKLCCVF